MRTPSPPSEEFVIEVIGCGLYAACINKLRAGQLKAKHGILLMLSFHSWDYLLFWKYVMFSFSVKVLFTLILTPTGKLPCIILYNNFGKEMYYLLCLYLMTIFVIIIIIPIIIIIMYLCSSILQIFKSELHPSVYKMHSGEKEGLSLYGMRAVFRHFWNLLFLY